MPPVLVSNAAWVYDPCCVDFYSLQLGSIHPHCNVTVVEDIYDASKQLLVKKGVLITTAIAQNLLHVHLAKPLEQAVELTNELSQAQLVKDLILTIEQDPILAAAQEHSDVISLLESLCFPVMESRLLRQKLTVMQLAMPELYERSLFCACLSVFIAKQMRLSEHDMAIVFAAALTHDVGMLHVDKNILQQTTPLSVNDWLMIQRHVIIGRDLLAAAENIPLAVACAVYEHHEQCDGTGYPLGKLDAEISLAGQINNVADAITAIHFNRYKKRSHSWRHVIAVIEKNAEAYFPRATEILLAIVNYSHLPTKRVVNSDQSPDFVEDFLHTNQTLMHWFHSLRDSLQAIGFKHGDRRLQALQNVMMRIATAAEGAGIFGEERAQLSTSAASAAPIDMKKVEAMYLAQQEIIFHMQRLHRMLQIYIDSDDCKNTAVKAALITGLTRVKNYLL